MSTPINDGGPAFPVPPTYHSNGQVEYGTLGMSLRDWFAGQALTGLLADGKGQHTAEKWAPHIAYRIADAMLEARKEAK
jgi:hypothetical protein